MLAKYKNCYSPAYRDDFFNDRVSGRYYGHGYGSLPAVNILEENDSFIIEVAAAGLAKEDFSIDLENDVLTISAEQEKEKKDTGKNYTRREFNFGSFKRSFRLNDEIDVEKIVAEHSKGILKVMLPKKEESVKQGPRSIEVK